MKNRLSSIEAIVSAIACLAFMQSCGGPGPGRPAKDGARDAASARELRADYRIACLSIADSYVGLEEKTGMAPAAFLAAQGKRDEEIGRKAEARACGDFVAALRSLRASFPDGHFGWSVERNLGRESSMTLGLVVTMIGEVPTVAATVWSGPNAEGRPLPDDAILTWDGKPAFAAVEELGRLIPQSTRRSTLEFAARYLGFEPAWMPLREKLHDVRITFRRHDGSIGDAKLRWQKGHPELTNNALPSLEEIPEGSFSVNGSLVYYTLDIGGRKVSVIHTRDFNSWGRDDLDLLVAKAAGNGAQTLVIDLKDSAGGEFAQLQLLLDAIGIDESLDFVVRTRDPSSGKIVEASQRLPELAQDDACSHLWTGPVILRTNSVAGSACDFLALAFRRSGRGPIIGEATAGRGIGSDSVTLPNSRATIDVPMRDRSLSGPGGRVEGVGVDVDFPGEGKLPALLAAYLGSR